MKFVSEAQLKAALQVLVKFAATVGKQRAQHVLPFLALKLKGIGADQFRPYTEGDDRDFYERFAKVREGHEPYFDPLEARFRIKSHYHSNVATARKGTFAKSWGGGELRKGPSGEEWKLDADYPGIVRAKILKKVGADEAERIPAVALAVFLYRALEFDDHTTLESLRDRFLAEFHFTGDEQALLVSPDVPDEIRALPFSEERLPEKAVEELAKSSGGEDPPAVDKSGGKKTGGWDLVIGESDPILMRALELLFEDRYSGIILVGPPGTSKSWYAMQIALHLVEGDTTRIHKIQFHKSYQYENFVESFAPRDDGHGFEMRDQLLLRVASYAAEQPDKQFVVVIDELSRSDPGRVFGEALTYMEPSRRGELFTLASGRERQIPPNVIFVASMNARDKSVSEIDDAFDRRMGKIALDPDKALLQSFLESNEMAPDLRRRVEAFFGWVNDKYYPLGHTFFLTIREEEGLRRLWENLLRFTFEKEFRFQPEVLRAIREKYDDIVFGGQPPGAPPETT